MPVIVPAFLFIYSSLTALGQTAEIITNAKVIELVRAGIGESVLIPKIRASKVVMDASQPGLLELKAAGVTDDVIVAMLDRAATNGLLSSSSKLGELVELPHGTVVTVLTMEKISGRKVKPGQAFMMEVADDIFVDGKMLIGKHSPVRAVVSEAKSPGMAGRSGRLSVFIESTTTIDGQIIKLRSAKSGKGGDRFGTALALSYVWGVGLLIPGKNAEIKAGTKIIAFTDESKFIAIGTRPVQ